MEQAFDTRVLYDIRDAIICLGFLAGIVGGIVLLTRKKTTAGLVAILGFLMLSLDPLSEIVLFRLMFESFANNLQTLDMVYTCISGVSIFLGVILLLVALILAARPDKPAFTPQI